MTSDTDFSVTDPLWEKILQEEEKTPQLRVSKFLTRITDAQVFVADILDLQKTASNRLLVEKMQGVPELVWNPEFWEGQEGDKGAKFLTDQIEKSFKEKIEKDPRWVLNQALVTYCTIFDAFLDSCVEAVFLQNPKILYGVAAGKNIELKKVVELGSVDAVVTEIREKEIKNFLTMRSRKE